MDEMMAIIWTNWVRVRLGCASSNGGTTVLVARFFQAHHLIPLRSDESQYGLTLSL